MVGRADREDVDRIQPAAGVAYLVSGELAPDVGERVAVGLRGLGQGAVQIIRAPVERGTVRGAQSGLKITFNLIFTARHMRRICCNRA